MKFVDEVSFQIASGHGGPGAVSFHREKFVAFGGPDGGDGGKGGSVIFEATTSRNTLVDFRFNKVYRGQDGQKGGINQMTGRDGEDLLLLVPVGTQISDDTTGELLADLDVEGKRWAVDGGRGGKGNMFFKSARNRTPRFAQEGEPGVELKVRLELKLLADVGLLGFPNAGKSTLISRISAARPKVADYPFTTLVPHLGVVKIDEGVSFVVADIPGLVEGASEGVGLGHQFLRHLDRCRVLVHLIPADLAVEQGVVAMAETLYAELAAYDPSLAERPQILCLSKVDCLAEDVVAGLLAELEAFAGRRVLGLSSVTGRGVDTLVRAMHRSVQHIAAPDPSGRRIARPLEADDDADDDDDDDDDWDDDWDDELDDDDGDDDDDDDSDDLMSDETGDEP